MCKRRSPARCYVAWRLVPRKRWISRTQVLEDMQVALFGCGTFAWLMPLQNMQISPQAALQLVVSERSWLCSCHCSTCRAQISPIEVLMSGAVVLEADQVTQFCCNLRNFEEFNVASSLNNAIQSTPDLHTAQPRYKRREYSLLFRSL